MHCLKAELQTVCVRSVSQSLYHTVIRLSSEIVWLVSGKGADDEQQVSASGITHSQRRITGIALKSSRIKTPRDRVPWRLLRYAARVCDHWWHWSARLRRNAAPDCR